MIIAERTKPFSTAMQFCQMKNAKMVEMTRENHQPNEERKNGVNDKRKPPKD